MTERSIAARMKGGANLAGFAVRIVSGAPNLSESAIPPLRLRLCRRASHERSVP